MTAEQYLALCEACDAALLAPASTIERVAITWLHVLNEHPSNRAKYNDVFGGRRGAMGCIKSTLRAVWQVRKWFKAYSPWHSSVPIPDGVDVIFVSHLLNESHAGAEDFYFGRLPEAFKERGLSSLVVLHNHTGRDRPELAARWASSMMPRLLLANTLDWRDELDLRQCLRQEAVRLRREAKQSVPGLPQRVRRRAAAHAVSDSTISALRFYRQMRRLVQRCRPKQIIVTYEGHAWERLAFAAARSVVPGVRCIGYHHAILFPRQHAVKRSLGAAFDPNIVATAGDVTRDVLAEATGLRHLKVVTVGTHRQEEPAGPLAEKILDGAVPACLAIPDGTVGECLNLFNFVFAAADLIPDVRFVIRLHPVVSFESLTKLDRRLIRLPKNVELSSRSINDDFHRCRWALYRGSGAAIRAVVAGLRPFYIALPNELSIDPLYSLDKWRRVITSVNDFVMQVTLDLRNDIRNLEAELEGAREFCKRYFMPVSPQTFYNEIVDASERENGDLLVNRQR